MAPGPGLPSLGQYQPWVSQNRQNAQLAGCFGGKMEA